MAVAQDITPESGIQRPMQIVDHPLVDLLLVLPVPIRQVDGKILLESQAFNGIERWQEHFPRIALACPVLPEEYARHDKAIAWRPAQELSCAEHIEMFPLPWAYSPRVFFNQYRQTRNTIKQLVSRARYMSFAIGGLIGDWAAIACLEAKKQHRPYSVWTDRVEPDVIRRTMDTLPLHKRLILHVMLPIMDRYHHYLIRHSALGLFHGQDCYQAYQPYCSNSHCVHDIHIKPQDQITDQDIARKIADVQTDRPLRIAYAGRASEMKGPIDWVRTLGKLHSMGIAFEAIWLGDGPMLSDMRDECAKLGIAGRVKLPGFTNDRKLLLSTLRNSDLLMFCHLTPESPRCLVESLICGCPIVGYESNYPRDLVSHHGGGLFSPRADITTLSANIANLNQDRHQLANLIHAAAQSGKEFSDEAVFRHRSDLMKQYL